MKHGCLLFYREFWGKAPRSVWAAWRPLSDERGSETQGSETHGTLQPLPYGRGSVTRSLFHGYGIHGKAGIHGGQALEQKQCCRRRLRGIKEWSAEAPHLIGDLH